MYVSFLGIFAKTYFIVHKSGLQSEAGEPKCTVGFAGAVKMPQRKKSCLTCALSLCEPTILWYWRANVCIYSLLYSPLLTKCAFTLQHQLHSVTVPSRPHHHSDKLHCHRESHFPTFPSPVKKKKNTHYPLLFCVALHPIVPPHSTP